MKKLKLLCLILLCSTPLMAEGMMVVTVDKNGKGTIQKVKNTKNLPANPPKGSTALILRDGEKAQWTDATQQELEILYDANTYKDKEIKLDEEEDKEIKLFEDLDSDEIELLDGVWKSVFDSTNMSGCSAMMQKMIKNFTPPSSKMTLKFSKPFNPNKDLMSGQFKWKKIKANKWKGTMYQSGAIPQGMSMNGEMLLGVLSEKKMSILLEQIIVLPKAIAQLTKSTTTCKVVTKGHYIKIK